MQHYYFLLTFCLNFIFFLQKGIFSSSKPPTLELQRKILSAWQTNSTTHSNNICFKPQHSRPKFPIIYNISLPVNCKQQPLVKLYQECIFKNLAYTTRLYYDKDQTEKKLNDQNPKNVKKSESFFTLALDLSIPFSWVKSSVCQTCDRMGKNCVQNCSYGLNKTALYDKTFACQKCSKTNKCAEIDSYAEGMSVIGQFVEVENLRFPKYPYLKLKNQKILWAHALSGQQFLMADGVLGLGKQYDEMNGGYADEENTKNNIDEEFESKTEDEIEEDNDIQDENQKNPSNMYLYKEEGISLLETIKQQIEDVDAQIFTLYISDDAHYPMHIGFGNYTTQYIHEPEQNQIKWIYSPQHTAMESQYSLWIINIQYIRIVKKNIQQQDEKKEKEEELYEVLEPLDSIELNTNKGLLSLSTTALVLPGVHLNKILQLIESNLNIKCSISKQYLFFVVCDEVQSLSDFDDLAMVIVIGYYQKVHLQINPRDLILDCKKKSKSKYSTYKCILNFQQSYDDKIILGEATLRNQYLVFEMNTKMIGFAPAKNKFNDMSFIQELEYLFEIVEQGFAADFPYILGLLCFSITGVVIFLVIRFKKYFKIRKLIIAEEKNDVKPLFKQNEHQMSEEMYKQLQMQESKDDKDTSLQPTQIGEY